MAIAALGDVVRGAGDYEAGEAGHRGESGALASGRKSLLCPRISKSCRQNRKSVIYPEFEGTASPGGIAKKRQPLNYIMPR